ncbi:MAG TPA: hypothetical protein VKM55_13280 [Candidatus Lokiarchaeia archaeon]|nr:hypothetical protein [Candidatus Lokiarchaeia archaeon]
MLIKWRERRTKPLKLMIAVFISFTAELVMLTIGLVDSAISGFYREVYRFSLPFNYSMLVVVNIILFMFTREITNQGRKGLKPVVIAGAILCVVLFLPWNWWGYLNTDYAGQINIRLYTMLGLVTFSYMVYIRIAWVCWYAMPEAKTPVEKTGLRLLFVSMILMICCLLMFIIDTVLIVAFHSGGYSIYVYIAWIFASCFACCLYLCVVMPPWFMKRLTKSV